MLERDLYPRQKDVMLICDKPVSTEFNFEEKFSSMSNIALVTSLRTGMVNNYSKEPVASTYKGISESDMFLTYLDYEGQGEGNFDYCKEICKEKTKEFDFYKMPNYKDVWVSARLYAQFMGLLEEIRVVQPRLIIVADKWTLFLLTGCSTLASNMGKVSAKKPLGCLDKFRASIMQVSECFGIQEHVLVPIIHTVNTVMMPDKVTVMELDIQKLGWMYNNIKELGVGYYLKPDKEYVLGTTVEVVTEYLSELLGKLQVGKVKVSIDVETMYHSIIDCMGFAYEIDKGLCIPFAHKGKANFWSVEDETTVLCLIREVMLHPNCVHVGQNYSYDCQYFWKLWGIHVAPNEDTMVLHHILYNYLPKNLAFLASRYCEHYTFWKDDISAIEETPETRWIYNIKDVCYTLEIEEVLQGLLASESKELQDLYRFQMDKLSPALIDTMNKGVRVDTEFKEELYTFFSGMLNDITTSINEMLGVTFNLNSAPQKKKLFKDFFGMKLKRKKGADTETCDSAAMLEYLEEYPLYRPFLTLLLEHSSLKVFTNNFLGMKLDTDDRARTQYRISGTDTGRLASTKNVFGGGGNLQNIPSKGKLNLKYALELVHKSEDSDLDGGLDSFIDDLLMPEIVDE